MLCHYLTLNISETVRDSYNGMNTWTYSGVSFQMTLSDLAKYSMTLITSRGMSATAELFVIHSIVNRQRCQIC